MPGVRYVARHCPPGWASQPPLPSVGQQSSWRKLDELRLAAVTRGAERTGPSRRSTNHTVRR
eukprot:5202864-Pyramimonas_sp.AAC.1